MVCIRRKIAIAHRCDRLKARRGGCPEPQIHQTHAGRMFQFRGGLGDPDRILHKLEEALKRSGIDLFPYVMIRTETEQRELENEEVNELA